MKNWFKNLNILLLLCALTCVSSNVSLQAAITATVNRSTLTENFNSSTHSVSWTVHPANHVTFTLVGDGLKKETWVGEDYFYLSGNFTVNREYNLTWKVNSKDPNGNSAYSIKVTKLVFDIDRASGINTYLKVGNGDKTKNLYYASNIPSGGVASGTMNEGENGSIRTIFYKPNTYSQISVNNIKVTYTLVPLINYTNDKSVAVTVCDDHKQFLNLSECASLADQSGHISLSYSLRGDNASDARIEDGKFYAYKVGTYTIRASVAAVTGCHDANTQDFTVTVTPVTLSLTAPTASEITYHNTLIASKLTGGSAKVGSCDVAGTWAWKYPETTPSIGDNQPFLVVFTPSENAGNYTGFETNALVDVKRAQFIFDGSGKEADDIERVTWCYDDNWEKDQKPSSEDSVLIVHNVVIRQEVSVYSVTINEGDTLTIMPTGGLTVGAGGITVATTGKLILKAETEGETKGQTGYLRISPYSTQPMPETTVELYTIGYYNMNVGNHQDVGTWQYVGSPIVNDGTLARNVFTKNMLYDWSEATGEWKNNLRRLVLQPFTGYATSQYKEEGQLVTTHGQLVDNGEVVLPLSYTESSATPGCNVFANSFTAPIDISKLEASDFSEGVDATIHLFNTGSKTDVATHSSESPEDVDVNAAGQYLSIPVINAGVLHSEFGYPLLIPAMQGFYVNTDREGTLTLNYEKLVWNTNLTTSPNTPLRAPKKNTEENEQTISGALQVTLATDGMTDNLFLLEAEHYDASFENGYDARKKMSCAFNIFSVVDDEHLAVDATNSIIGTRVGVRTGDETAYTIVFGKVRSENEWALLDYETNQTIDINEGTEYTFFAEPNSMIEDRFQIVERENAPAITTDIENVENESKAHKFIKDGQLYILKNGILYNAMGAVVR